MTYLDIHENDIEFLGPAFERLNACLPSTATCTLCPLLVKRVPSRRLFSGLSSATRTLNICCSFPAAENGKGNRPVLEPGDDGLVATASVGSVAELEDALSGAFDACDKMVSEGGVGKATSEGIRCLGKSPESAFRNGIVIDTFVPFPSPFEDRLIWPEWSLTNLATVGSPKPI